MEEKMESRPLRKVRMGCSLKVEDEVGHSDDIDTEKGLRRSKRKWYSMFMLSFVVTCIKIYVYVIS
ncbi:hypothetical protein D8674_007802 [Pyrus ussuriensis x Pyrus communis]|uniref:Uncharacterized protein n=1 Tax=Pyrus ussuriensis x Pyrus communis TaxID=2448454 RepID=A0A5N5HU55_9ROSA|nr:hypothetical protein D8674_007802 [Pyrus ussuriensis x Pyrus communis]